MAEENEGWETGGEAAGATSGAAATALALGVAAQNERVAAEAETFLKEQTKLVQLQAKELDHELRLRHWSLRVRHVSALLKLAFEVSLALVAIALACFIGGAVWSAAHADGLVIDAFSVPSNLAAQGLTGEVVASRMLDRLTEMQDTTVSARAPQSYANDWGNDIKVEIPDTGVSFGEAYRYLKGWLGHETHLGGEVVRTDSGLSITARVSGDNNASFAGTNFDALVEKAAEYVYGDTQPYRYAVYLRDRGHADEAIAILKRLATGGAGQDRPWGYIGWANFVFDSDINASMRLIEHAQELQPNNAIVLENMAIRENLFGHPEKELHYETDIFSNQDRGSERLINAATELTIRDLSNARAAQMAGDFRNAVQDGKNAIATAGPNNSPISYTLYLARFEIDLHEPETARTTAAQPGRINPATAGTNGLFKVGTQMLGDGELQNWRTVLSDGDAVLPLLSKYAGLRFQLPTTTTPILAYANAKLGNIAVAEAEIAPTPGDCYDCLITRARIADVEGQHARADWWFDRAVKSNPSIPFAYAEWGDVLLDRGDPDGAIAKFTIANQKGPHFADPIEMWGEALMKKNRSDLAVAKFGEAEKYAPNWGRLHLKWGEALRYAGRKDEAQKQFALAAGLGLSAADKTELAKVSHG